MAITPNKENLRNRSDYGVRVARPGYDANNCAQNQLLFNSGWPILQIAEIVKLENMQEEMQCEYTQTTTVINTDNWQVISSEVIKTYPSEPPSGYESSRSYEYDPYEFESEFRLVQVNKKYVRLPVAGTRTAYNYPYESHTEGNILTTVDRVCVKSPYAKKQHRLGFTPFFVMSEDVSDVSGYAVLFSIDISKDVDYPYTERPLELIRPNRDYGIKSASKFGSKVPGLCSNMFSKLVQAVKTEETSQVGGGDTRAIWSPVASADKAEGGELLPYEFYGFIGETSSPTGIDGGVYYRREYPFYISRFSGGTLNDAWAVSSGSFQTLINTKNSLVVLRSPMVSPEYEERTLS